MPSPFPGMDPYLEAPPLWPGLHQPLITYISDDLQTHIRPTYHARIGERRYIVEASRDIYPDVAVVERPSGPSTPTGSGGTAVAVADEPVTVTVDPVELREPFVEIIHNAGGEVVTVIEVLSPANKTPGQGYQLYRQKQQEILNSPIHLVEIDLLSQGLPTLALPESAYPDRHTYRYLVSVNRATDRHRFELYPFSLSQRLPRCRIPLKSPDPDVVLDLPALFTRCYDNGGYPDFVDYSQPPPVPLSEEEQTWLAENVKS